MQGWLQIVVFCLAFTAIVPLLGGYMARVFTYEARNPQGWKAYAGSLLVFSGVFWLFLYALLRTQTLHPWNHRDLHSAPWDVTFNTVSSFVTNTNWQYYGGETTMSFFSQMAGLAVQNFVSAGVGLVVAIALIRGIAGRPLGNFFEDLTRAVFLVLLPISIVGTFVLVSQGVVQDL